MDRSTCDGLRRDEAINLMHTIYIQISFESRTCIKYCKLDEHHHDEDKTTKKVVGIREGWAVIIDLGIRKVPHGE